MKSNAIATARRHLDSVLTEWQSVTLQQRPAKGWIRAIRDAIGMTTTVLATRLDRAPATIVQFEHNEVAGNITLNSLQTVAEAMNCKLVYTLVPNTSLEDFVATVAKQKAVAQLAATTHTMLLENQSLSADDQQRMLDDLVKTLKQNPKRLWD